MRTYLVVIDETPEAEVALRFAARRAAKTGGTVQILAIIPPIEFVGLGDVQATMEDEARQHAEAVVTSAAGILIEESGIHPGIMVQAGEPIGLICQAIAENPEIGARVLGAAANGAPGPLVAHFAGAGAGSMPCPIMIIPGALDAAALDRLS